MRRAPAPARRLRAVIGLWAGVWLAGALPPAAAVDPRPGDLDAGFGNRGQVVVSPPAEAGEWPGAEAVQPDGAVVVVGTAAPARNGYAFLLLRFLPNGQLDPSFGTGGRANQGRARCRDFVSRHHRAAEDRNDATRFRRQRLA